MKHHLKNKITIQENIYSFYIKNEIRSMRAYISMPKNISNRFFNNTKDNKNNVFRNIIINVCISIIDYDEKKLYIYIFLLTTNNNKLLMLHVSMIVNRTTKVDLFPLVNF